jgi:RimJ/RimL family protein N-acetyltransferase
MTIDHSKNTRNGAVAVSPLGPADRGRMLAHLLALAPADRALRFGFVSDDAAIARYVAAIDFDGSVVLGVADLGGALVGMAHVAFEGDVAELGLSVAAGARRRGVGNALARAALRAAERRGAREFRFDCAASNVGMRRLAEQLGMPVVADGSQSIARRQLVPPRVMAAA